MLYIRFPFVRYLFKFIFKRLSFVPYIFIKYYLFYFYANGTVDIIKLIIKTKPLLTTYLIIDILYYVNSVCYYLSDFYVGRYRLKIKIRNKLVKSKINFYYSYV